MQIDRGNYKLNASISRRVCHDQWTGLGPQIRRRFAVNGVEDLPIQIVGQESKASTSCSSIAGVVVNQNGINNSSVVLRTPSH